MNKELTKVSKYLSYILRHKPESIGLLLEPSGWASVDELIERTTDFTLTSSLIKLVVETNDKQRFQLDLENNKIRANQGHSIDVAPDLMEVVPPSTLLHGTAERFLPSIFENGLKKQQRHHVHLTESEWIARSVGTRYGKPVLLQVDASKMSEEGFSFYRSVNNVWLVESVPATYLKLK